VNKSADSSAVNRGVPAGRKFAIVLAIAASAIAGLVASLTVAGAAGTEHRDAANKLKAEYARPGAAAFAGGASAPKVPHPDENPFTAERERLGRMLFFDPRLSGSGWISCASCHNPGLSWGDGLPRAIGHGMQQLGRRTPTLLNLAWAEAFFWDGRADTLEQQALGPIEAAGEMNLPLDEMVKRLKGIAGYRQHFERAYPREATSPISTATVAKAIATFERGIVSAEAPFDRWVSGREDAVPAAAKRGFVLFNGKAGCNACHAGWRLTNDSFHDIGVPGEDVGRAAVLPPGMDVGRFAFKTPTLRNVAGRAPYMHDGSIATLDDVVDFYNRGGAVKRPSLSPEIKPLELTPAEQHDLVAFMKTLTSHDPEVRVPALPQ
jgi:cytochrome c peroxidase